jgi:hypothetical protein
VEYSTNSNPESSAEGILDSSMLICPVAESSNAYKALCSLLDFFISTGFNQFVIS